MSTNKVQFVLNGTVNVWKTTGVRDGKHGIATSERPGQQYPDIEPSENLTVMQKFGATKALCKRENRDGQPDELVTVHINHINPSSAYYATRSAAGSAGASNSGVKKAAVKQLSPQERLAQLQEETRKVMAEQEALENASNLEEEVVPEADRDEAEALLAEAMAQNS